MGGDGGSIPTRSELVKVKGKAERADPNEVLRTRWTTCSISGEALGSDVAADELGNLYNRDEALAYVTLCSAGRCSKRPLRFDSQICAR